MSEQLFPKPEAVVRMYNHAVDTQLEFKRIEQTPTMRMDMRKLFMGMLTGNFYWKQHNSAMSGTDSVLRFAKNYADENQHLLEVQARQDMKAHFESTQSDNRDIDPAGPYFNLSDQTPNY